MVMKLLFIILFLIISIITVFSYQIIPVGRGASIGAFTGVADDVSAILYNSAGLSALNSSEISLYNTDLYGLGIRYNQLLYTFPLSNRFSFGFGIANISYDDSELDFSENKLDFSLSSYITNNFHIGLNIKYLDVNVKYFSNNVADGISKGLDLGLLYIHKNNLRAGINFFNIGNTNIKYSDGEKSAYFNSNIRAGLSYNYLKYLFAIDYDFNNILYIGTEYYLLPNHISIVGGIQKQFSPDNNYIYSLGARLSYKDMYLDYSLNLNHDLGNLSKFSLGYKFGYKKYVQFVESDEINEFFPHLINLYKENADYYFSLDIQNDFFDEIDIVVSLDNNKYFSKTSTLNFKLKPNSLKTIEMPLYFSSNIDLYNNLDYTYINAKINYTLSNRNISIDAKFPVKINTKNSMIWDEPYKIGSFINPKSKIVTQFNKRLFSQFADELFPVILPENILKTMIIFNGIKSLGFKYRLDTKFPYRGIFEEQKEIELINFPHQTFITKQGDCDDLTVLFSSLLLNLGIDIKIVLLDNHIFFLFESGINNITEYEYLKPFLININGKYYVPFESTMLKDTFFNAWIKGKEIYNDNNNKIIINISEIWSKYQPLVFNENYYPDIPFKDEIKQLLYTEYLSFEKIMNENIIIQELPYDELLTKANEAIEQKNYFLAINIYMYLHNNNPSEISYAHNLGNLFYLINDFNKSISYYLYSSGLDKDNPFYYAQISILYNYLGDNIKALYYYKKAIELDKNYFDKYINDL